jgi:hypothetical protein
MTFRGIQACTLTAISIACFATSSGTLKAATASTVSYTATGTFAAPPNSGNDTLRLAGEPFTVNITVSTSAKPYKTGSNYIVYNAQKLTGTVHSGLLGPTPVNIASGEATIEIAINPGKYDQFVMEAPIKVVGISLTLKAVVTMPLGTISKLGILPFTAPVAFTTNNATLTYSDGTSTVLGIQSGTLTTKQ